MSEQCRCSVTTLPTGAQPAPAFRVVEEADIDHRYYWRRGALSSLLHFLRTRRFKPIPTVCVMNIAEVVRHLQLPAQKHNYLKRLGPRCTQRCLKRHQPPNRRTSFRSTPLLMSLMTDLLRLHCHTLFSFSAEDS